MEVMTYFHYGRQQRGGGGEVEGWGWNSWHSTDEMGVIWVFGCCYGETKMSLFQKYILDFAWCSPCPLSVYFALWSSFPHISACYCYILMCVCVCVCVCSCLSVWQSVPGKAVTGCWPRPVNLAARLCAASDRERGGHRPTVAAPAGPIRRECSCLPPCAAPCHRSPYGF